ncbi:MAG: SRPBCC domain-containing protein [Ornithinimicrobium sp.]
MTDVPQSIELEIEVSGTPEEVWRAIATGPGITSWYVPHEVEEREGGTATASFGPGPEMQVPGRVAAWEPPRRVVFDGGEGVGGLAFEWLVEAREGGTCVVRLVNSGFGEGQPWDDQYDDMVKGWQTFLLNLRLHLDHFAGRSATSSLPMATWPLEPDKAWHALTSALSMPQRPALDDRLELNPGGSGHLAGRLVDVAPRRVALLLDVPAPGTAFVTAQGHGATCTLSVWAYLYGEDRDRLAAEVTGAWQGWLNTGTPDAAEADEE